MFPGAVSAQCPTIFEFNMRVSVAGVGRVALVDTIYIARCAPSLDFALHSSGRRRLLCKKDLIDYFASKCACPRADIGASGN